MNRRQRATKEQRTMEATAELAQAVPAAAPALTAAPTARHSVSADLHKRVTEALARLDRGDWDGNRLTQTEIANVRLALQYHERAGISLAQTLAQLGVDARKIQPFETRSTYRV
jgi:hypothetical protein